MDNCDRQNPRNARYLNWIDMYGPAAASVAAGLKTSEENILGLSAIESAWGQGPFARDGRNNFFSLHYPSPLSTGFVTTADGKVKVSTYLNFASSAKAFAVAYGHLVTGQPSAHTFAASLQNAGKYGINRDGTKVPSFVPDVMSVASGFEERLKCGR
jgi:hypothetical protein